MEYKGITKERKTSITILLFSLGVIMLVRAIMINEWFYIPIIIFVLLACFYKKEQVISEEGIDIKSMIFGKTIHNMWTWDEITTLHTDYKKAKPNVMLHIGKDIVTRTYIMTPADCRSVLHLAAEMNPGIYIEDQNDEFLRKKAEKERPASSGRLRSRSKKRKHRKIV